jgi:hypothetical protein
MIIVSNMLEAATIPEASGQLDGTRNIQSAFFVSTEKAGFPGLVFIFV